MEIQYAQELIIKYKGMPKDMITLQEKRALHTARETIEDAITQGYVLCNVAGALMGIEYHPLTYKDELGHKVISIDVVKSKIKGACK